MKQDVLNQLLVDDFADHSLGRDAVLFFCNSDLHYDDEHRYEPDFFSRKLRPHVLKHLDFSEPIIAGSLASYSAFAANRALFAMHEAEFLMLPTEEPLDKDRFDQFYHPAKLAAAGVGIPFLERYLFSHLEDEIVSSENWTFERLEQYFEDYIEQCASITSLPSSEAILTSKIPTNAARDWLIQLAPDFLIESSPMARYASGNFGRLSSNLFKIIIDELGYGVFEKKHSTLYEATMRSVGLNANPHHYWQYYLNGSLLLANYYNMITRNKRGIFRYIGAIFQAETSFITSCRIWRDTLKQVLPEIDVRYFDEHCHIDTHHSRMVFDGLVKPAVDQYGLLAANEIIRGFEEACLIADFAETDFVQQIRWKDDAEELKAKHGKVIDNVMTAASKDEVQVDYLDEPRGELSITHSHDQDELCHIISGKMEFLNGFEHSTNLEAGEGIVIRRHRLHGAIIRSDQCEYQIYSIGDLDAWTSAPSAGGA